MLTNIDIFEEFYRVVKQSDSISDVYKEYGGSSVYIPSYKTSLRNSDILDEYMELKQKGLGSTHIVKLIATTHNLSVSQIYNITKEARGAI